MCFVQDNQGYHKELQYIVQRHNQLCMQSQWQTTTQDSHTIKHTVVYIYICIYVIIFLYTRVLHTHVKNEEETTVTHLQLRPLLQLSTLLHQCCLLCQLLSVLCSGVHPMLCPMLWTWHHSWWWGNYDSDDESVC